MEITRRLDETRWREFITAHPQARIFHTPEMYQVFARAQGYHPTLWAAVEGTSVRALFLPVLVTLKGGFLRRLTTRAIAYGSVLYEPGAKGETALRELLQAYVRANRRTALFTELRNLSDLSEIQPLLASLGFHFEPHLNYLIDLARSPDDLLASIGKRTRKNIRRAIRRGDVTIDELTTREGITRSYALLQQTYANARVPLSDASLFEAAFEILAPRGMLRVTLAQVEAQDVGASLELLYKDVIYGWYGGVDRAFNRYSPNELLMWRILEWGAAHGYRCYDFGGAGKPDQPYGVRDFKAKFGGTLVNYGRNVYVHAPLLLRASKLGYALYQSALPLWGKIRSDR